MKLRVLGNSLRIRLRRSEVEQLAATGRVDFVCDFGSRQLRYSVTSEEVPAMTADLTDDQITIRIPAAQVREWADSKQTGIAGQTPTLSLLVEKDFVRTAIKEADDHDRYTNPRSGRTPPPPPKVQ